MTRIPLADDTLADWPSKPTVNTAFSPPSMLIFRSPRNTLGSTEGRLAWQWQTSRNPSLLSAMQSRPTAAQAKPQAPPSPASGAAPPVRGCCEMRRNAWTSPLASVSHSKSGLSGAVGTRSNSSAHLARRAGKRPQHHQRKGTPSTGNVFSSTSPAPPAATARG